VSRAPHVTAAFLAAIATIRTPDAMARMQPSGFYLGVKKISQKKRRLNRRRGHVGAGT
jgi:hypothetical protein